jgi:hypothetical protein
VFAAGDSYRPDRPIRWNSNRPAGGVLIHCARCRRRPGWGWRTRWRRSWPRSRW